MDRRVNKLNVKINSLEKEELNRLMNQEHKSISDLVRIAIRNTFDVEGFESSYESNIFSFKGKKSIFD